MCCLGYPPAMQVSILTLVNVCMYALVPLSYYGYVVFSKCCLRCILSSEVSVDIGICNIDIDLCNINIDLNKIDIGLSNIDIGLCKMFVFDEVCEAGHCSKVS